MSKLSIYLPALLLAFAPLSSFAASTNPQYNSAQEQGYEQQLSGEVKNQENLVQTLQAQMARQDIVLNQADVARYENAVLMLEIKRTLLGNFVGTASLQSQPVRSLLLNVMKKEMISPGDLASLQNLVNSEKAKMQQQNPPATTTTTPAGAASVTPTQTTAIPTQVGQ